MSIPDKQDSFLHRLNAYLENYTYDISTAANTEETELFEAVSKMDLGSFENVIIFFNYIITIRDVPNSKIGREILKTQRSVLNELCVGKLFH